MRQPRSIGAWALLVLALMLAAGPARAADERALQEARTRFQAGVQLFHEGSLDAALAEFRKAYQLAPTFRVLYNIAQVQAEMRDYVEASKSFRQYLAEGGAEVPADRRAQVEAELQKLERRVSVLEITTNVPGASILIDDVPVGASPLGAPLLVNAGSRRITATKPGRVTTARSLTVPGGDRVKVHIELPEASTAPAPVPLASTPAPVAEPSRTKMWVALAVTAALGVGTGTFALLTQQKKKDFEAELDRYPTDLQTIDRARRRMALHAAVTDGLAAATLLSAGITIYFAVSGGSSEPPREQARIRLLPSLGGLTVAGRF